MSPKTPKMGPKIPIVGPKPFEHFRKRHKSLDFFLFGVWAKPGGSFFIFGNFDFLALAGGEGRGHRKRFEITITNPSISID